MRIQTETEIQHKIDELYRLESRRVFAVLVRLLKDFDLAEEAMQEAFAQAIIQWPETGIPVNPRAWLVSTGRFKAIDALRRCGLLDKHAPELAERFEELAQINSDRADQHIEDDRLRLIFTCCHPAIDPQVQVSLTLREVCGLTTEEIAAAFLTTPSTMAQRIVRGKAKIRDAGIPFKIPDRNEYPERLDAVLSVIYLVFNEGYAASSGKEHTRADLSGEAIRLARLVLELLPDPEVMGLLALMLLHESRREARTSAGGEIVLLEDQDRTRWNRELINEGKQLINRSLASNWLGTYTLHAAISAVHVSAATPNETDWQQIVGLYDVLLRVSPSPVIELNRAVAVAKRDGQQAGLNLINALLNRGELTNYYLAHSAKGELLRQLGEANLARQSFEQALSLVKQEQERKFLIKQIHALSAC